MVNVNPSVRVNLTLDADTVDLLRQASKHSGVTVAGIVSRFLGAHMGEIGEYLNWMDAQEKGGRRYEFGKNFLNSYGPETLIDAIKQVDPNWKTQEDQFKDSVSSSITSLDDLKGDQE